MDKNIDVLAVMELAYRHLNGGTDSLSTSEFVAAHAGMKEARAAVAGLIEALDLAAYGEYLPESVEQQIRSALARVKGA